MPRRTWVALSVASASIFLFVLDSGLLSVSFPGIEASFPRSSRSTLSWVATGYLVALAALLLVGGRVSDRRGRKRVYLGGLFVFSIGALATSLAPTVSTLIAARVIEGFGGAFMTASSLVLVLGEFPPERRHAALGVWGAIGSAGSVLAPTAGAFAVQEVSWRLGFGLVAACGAVAFVAGAIVLREPVEDSGSSDVDPWSVLAGSSGLGLLALVLSQGRRWGWGSRATVSVAATAVVMLIAFAARSRHEESPLLEPRLFQFRQWTSNTLAAGIQQVGFFSWFLTTPLILVNVWGWSVLQAGSAMAVGLVMSAVSGPLGGRWADRRGTTIPIVLSAVVTAAGPGWLALTARTQPSFLGAFLPATVLMGAGGGICGMLTTGGALDRLPPDILGAANSAHQLFRRVAGMAGVAVALSLLGDTTGPALLSNARSVWWLVAGAHIAMCVPLLLSRPYARPRT